MAVTESNYTVSNSSTTNYSFTFPYLKTTDVKLSINGVASSAFTFANATTIQLNSNPTVGDKLRIYRETDDSKLEAEFFAGSAIKSSDLNDNFNQNLYVTQESNNKIDAAWTSGDETIDSTETWASNNTRVATTGAIDGRIDSKIDTALTTDVVGGQSITITDNSPGSGQITASVTAGSIRGTELAADAVDGTKIADDSIDSEHYVAGSIDLEHMSANSVDSDQYVDGSIDLAHMSANSVDSDQYVDGSIDTAHIADAQVTHVKLANDCIDGDNIQNDVINSEHYAAGSIDTEHIGDLQITTAKVDNGSITTAKIADSSVTTSKIATSAVGTSRLNTGAVTTDKLAADAVDSSKLADNSVDSEHYVDGSIDTAHLGDLQVTTAKIAADAIDGTKLADNAVSAEHIAANAVGDSEIATGALDNRYYTETELDAGQLDNRYYTETESDARYFNVSTGDTIKDGDTFPDNDTTIATTAAINDRIIDLVDDVGGFVPIANETSFPNANPDVNNGTGTIVSIGSLAANHTSNGSGVITIANGTVGNSTVTINGADNNTTYSAGYGMLVETTSTLNTYTFHRLSSKATEVTTVASNITNINTVAGNNTNINTVAGANSNISTVAGSISNVNTTAGSIANVNTVATNINSVNDFSDVYRIASSAPTSHLHEGDLYFDTTSNELKVYNGSAWQGGVTATGNLAGLGANTFTGNQSLGDNNKVIFGTGGDLEIYFDGSNSYIKEPASVAGQLILQGWNGTDIRQGATGEHMIRAIGGGQVELYYDNTKRFETNSAGVTVSGNCNVVGGGMTMQDTYGYYAGTGNDLSILHDGSNSYIRNATSNLILSNSNTDTKSISLYGDSGLNENLAHFIQGGAVELYYDNSKKFDTQATGVKVYGDYFTNDSNKINLGTGNDLQLYHDGSNSYIDNDTGTLNILAATDVSMWANNTEQTIKGIANGSVELYYDGSKKLDTYSSGVTVYGNLAVNDNGLLAVGDSADLQIYHDGSNSYITNSAGGLNICSANSSPIQIIGGTNFAETMGRFNDNGAVELYYDSSKKLETYASGLYVTGNIVANQDNATLVLGAGNDLNIYHNGSTSWITNNTSYLYLHADDTSAGIAYLGERHFIKNEANTEQIISAYANGAVELYYDNALKCSTYSDGLNFPDLGTAAFGASNDMKLYHYNNENYIVSNGTLKVESNYVYINDADSNNHIRCEDGSYVSLHYDGVKKLETQANGITVTGLVSATGHLLLNAADDQYIKLGAGNDLQIYHDGTDSEIKESTGNLNIICNSQQAINLKHGSENMLRAITDGAVELYYDNSKKLETHASGITISGTISANAGSFLDNGTAGPVINISGDDANLWYGRIGNETYHDNLATGFRFYVNNSGSMRLYHTGNAEYKDWLIGSYDGTTYKTDIWRGDNGVLGLYHDGNLRLTTVSGGITVTGTVTDSTGELRTIVQNTQSGAYTLVAADAGKHILASGNITVPDSVFSAGQAITIVNNTAGNLTITKGTNMYNTADGTNANRTLATRGMATLLFTAADTAYISGAGLS